MGCICQRFALPSIVEGGLDSTIRCGIFGLGQVARIRHVEAYRRDQRAQVVIAFDPDPQKAAVAEKLGIPEFTTNIDTFWETHTDVVSV